MKLKKLFALALAVCMMALAVPAAFAAGLTLDYGTPGSVLTLDDGTGSSAPVSTVRNTSSGTSAAARAGGAYSYDAVTLPANPAGIEVSKTVKETSKDVFHVTLESFVTGDYEITTETVKIPVDITLVLDISESMNEYIQVGNKYELGDLDTDYGANAGIYRMERFGESCAMRYSASTGWQYYGTVVITNIWKPVDLAWFGEGTVYVHKMDAMKIAALKFVDTVLGKVNADGVAHTITIVSSNNAAVTALSKTPVTNANETTIKNAIKGLGTSTTESFFGTSINKYFGSGTTDLDLALTASKTAIGSKPAENRSRVVLVISDGKPTAATNTNDTTFDTPKANAAIATSKAIKALDKTYVYTVGVFAEASTSSTSNENLFLQYLSSNYKNATAMDNAGTSTGTTYYKAAPTSLDTNAAFEAIFAEVDRENTTGGVELELDAGTVLTDTLTTYFQVNRSTIKTYTAKYKAHPSSGREFYDKVEVTNLTVGGDLGSVTVEGFDYTANAVTDTVRGDSADYDGFKLIVEFDIVPKAGFLGGVNVPTNDLMASNIVEDGNVVAYFPKPDLVDVDVVAPTPAINHQTIYLSGSVADATNLYTENTYTWENHFVTINYVVTEGATEKTGALSPTDCTDYTVTCTVDGDGAGTDEKYNKATTATATVHVLKPTVEAAETTTYISNTVSMPADTTEDNTVYDSHVTAWTDTTEGHTPAGVNVQPSVPDAAKLTWEFYDGETKVEQYTATNKECKELTAVLCINGNNYEKLYKNTYTVHVLTPNLKADSTKIYLGDDTNLNLLVQWNNWNACTHGKAKSDDVRIPSVICEFEGVGKPEAYTNTTCENLTATWTSGNYSTSAKFDVHVLWPTISVADDTIYLGDTSKLTASISGWTCDEHEKVTADQPTTGNFKFYDENGNEVKNLTVSPHDCAEYTAKLVLADQPISKSFWVHVLTAGVTVDDQVIYLSDSVTAKDTTITWQNECDEHKRTVAAEEEPLSYTVVFNEDGNTTSVDACGSYTAYLKVGNTVYKEEEFKDSFDVHVLEPQIKADSFAMYLSNNVNLNERQYITEWKCVDKTEANLTEGRVKPPVAYDFYQNIAGTAEENTSAYAPSEDVTLTVVVKVNGNEYSKEYQGTFAIDVLKPIFSVNQKEVWANYLSNVEVYTQYGNEVKSVDWDSTTYAIVGEEPENISCTFKLEKIAGDGDWDKTDATKYQTGTNEDTFKVVKATWTYADGKSFVATGDRVKCNDLYDFVIHTNKFQLTIKTDWTESSGEQQSAIFTVTPDNTDLMPIKVVVPKGVNSVVVAGLFSGQEYTIAEDNGWTWRYGTAADAVYGKGEDRIACVGGLSLKALNGTDEVTMSFDDGDTYNAKWLADEDCVVNKATTQATITNPALSVKKKDEEVTNA